MAGRGVHGCDIRAVFALLIVLILLLVGAVPSWGHSRDWGYGPSGILGLLLVVVLVLVIMEKIPHSSF
jgi:hypothetical protein